MLPEIGSMVASDSLSIARRLAIWLVEMLCAIMLLSPLLIALFGRSNGNSLSQDLVLGLGLSGFFILASGYFATTGVLSVLLRRRNIWIYPTLVAVLFVGHEQAFFKGRHAPDFSDVKIQIAGACVMFTVGLLGNWFAERWR